MRALALLAIMFLFSACGAETATTATTVAELKVKEAQTAKQTMDRVEDKLNYSLQQAEQRRRTID